MHDTDAEASEALIETPAAALERAIRAEGYEILIDTQTGAVRLTGGNCKTTLGKIRAAARSDKMAGGAFPINALSWSEIEQICDEALYQ